MISGPSGTTEGTGTTGPVPSVVAESLLCQGFIIPGSTQKDRLLELSQRGATASLAPVILWTVAVSKLVSVAVSHKLTRG